ncbi:MAG: ribosome-associated translation inhibitor RaiA [Deltaproteobacteria bacterium]|nr:ribosome-associated translation inhibitor RaiA [Deltaproteobacteria bacterium]
MHITVTFRHMDSSSAIREYAEEKSARLEKYLVEPIEIHWVLSVEKIRHKAEATITSKNLGISAHIETDEMYSAIDMTTNKLEKQVRKHKEKLKKHKFKHPEDASVRYAGTEEGLEEEEEEA